jgi:hypothetical protein
MLQIEQFTIQPTYKCGLWVFTDPNVASPWVPGGTLVDEPFVEGIEVMFDTICEQRKGRNPVEGDACRVTFGLAELPDGHDYTLRWLGSRDGQGGCWHQYECMELRMDGWLCPSLLGYFPRAPRWIYVKIDALD